MIFFVYQTLVGVGVFFVRDVEAGGGEWERCGSRGGGW